MAILIVIRSSIIQKFKNDYGSANMICCYAKAQGMSAFTQEAILLLNDQRVIILFISKITNKLIQKVEFSKTEILKSVLKKGILFDAVWTFSGRKQKWKFRIMYKILPLGNMQKEFLDYLFNSDFIS